MFKLLICLLCIGCFHAPIKSQENVPIYFREFSVELLEMPKMGDTLYFNKSSRDDFKFVFYDSKGKCYCEHYVYKKLYEKGNFDNSLDTLKRYISGRDLEGNSSKISVQKYFEPLKNGEWVIYKSKKVIKENYLAGIKQF